jgi:hypothetical protein
MELMPAGAHDRGGKRAHALFLCGCSTAAGRTGRPMLL